MDTNKTRDLEQAINKYRGFGNAKIKVRSASDKELSLYIEVDEDERTFILKYGWGKPSATMDILLNDQLHKRSYIIYMTGDSVGDLAHLIDNSYLICDKFLRGDYRLKSSRVFFRKKADIYFDDPQIIYKYASPTKTFVSTEKFLTK